MDFGSCGWNFTRQFNWTEEPSSFFMIDNSPQSASARMIGAKRFDFGANMRPWFSNALAIVIHYGFGRIGGRKRNRGNRREIAPDDVGAGISQEPRRQR